MNCRNTYAQPPRRTRRWGSWLATAALALAMLPITGLAQSVTVGNGTTTQGFPIGQWYGYEYSASLYTAAEVTALNGQQITAVGWYATQGAAAHPIKVYVKEVSGSMSAETWATMTTGATLVYDGSITPVANVWNTINFTAPYTYLGGNLLVLVENNHGGTGLYANATVPGVQYTSSTNNHQYWRTDNNPPSTTGLLTALRPNITIDYVPAPGCTATTAPGATTGPISVCSGVDFTLGLTNVASGESGITYAWFVSTDGTATFNPVGGNSPSLTLNQTEESWYYCEVTCDQGTTEASQVLNVQMNAPSACYCTPSGTNSSYYVNNFSTTGGTTNITNNGSGYSTGGYGNFTGQTVTQEQGGSVNFSSTYSTNTTYGFKVWVDWNQDGDFDDAGEIVFTSTSYSAGHMGTITVPLTATPGVTRMRVGNASTPNSGPASACVTNIFGEFEDYSFEVVALTGCTATTAPGATTGPADVCSGDDITLGLTNVASGETGITYEWYFSTDGTTFNPVGGNSPSLTTSQTVESWYYCEVTCDQGTTETSTVLNVKMKSANQCYCTPGGTNTSYYINNFSTTGGSTNITNNASGYSTGGYGDFSGMTVTQLAGGSVDFSTTYSTASTYGLKIWVDWNQDGDFDDAGETVFTSTSYLSGHTGTINVPVSATPGVTRMRIGNSWSPNTGPADPCMTNLSGEFEDYSFEVVALNCSPATATATVVPNCPNGFGIDVDITDLGDGSSVTINYSVNGTAQTPIVVNATGTTNLTGFAHGDAVAITVAHESDNTCDLALGTIQFYCPPANDECADAITLTVNPDYDCGTVTAGTVLNATASGQGLGSCFGTADDDVWYKFIATSTAHRVSLLNVAGSVTDMYMKFYEGSDCGTMTDLFCSDPNEVNLTGLTVGETYYVRVYTYTSTPGQTTTFNICVGTAPPPPGCGETWYDTGGPNADYGASENYITTLCPDNPGDLLTATFTSFYTEANWDKLFIYDGPDISSPKLASTNGSGSGTTTYGTGGWWGNLNSNLPGPFTSSSPDGCLTFAFVSDGGTQYSGWAVDITCTPAPSCLIPAAVSTSNVSGTSAMVSWTCTGCMGSYIVEYGPAGFTPGTDGNAGGGTIWTGGPVASSPVTVTGLSSSTAYSVYVRQMCGVGEYGPNSTVANFSTAYDCDADAIAIPSLPVTNQAVVCGAANNLNSSNVPSPCGSASTSYMGGQEALYTFVPTLNGQHTISYSGVTYTGIFLYANACPNTGGTCVGSAAASSSSTNSLSANLTAGTTYYLWIDTWPSPNSPCPGTFSITEPQPPPANDECADAVTLTVNPDYACGTVTAGTVAFATASTGATGCSGSADDDVWYSFIATGTAHRVSLLNVAGSVTDMFMAFYSGSCGSLTNIFCSDPNEANLTGLVAGNTYYVRVYTYTATSGQTTTFNICVGTPPPPPVNNDCADAIAVACGSTVSGTTVNATATSTLGTCVTTLNTAPGVWYTATGTGADMTASLCGSSFDTKIGIFTGSCGSFTCVAGNDDFCGTQSQVTWASAAGVTYYIYVTAFSSNSGTFDLALTCEAPPTCLAPTGLALTGVTVNSVNFSWNASATPVVGYDWEVRQGGSVVASGSTGAGTLNASASGLTANLSHDVYVRANCGGGDESAWAGPVNFYTGYCAAGGTTASRYIDSFSTTGGITDISNTGTGFSTGGYADYSAQAVTVVEGGSFGVQMVGGNADTYRWAIWVDWNNDMQFANPGEREFFVGSYTNAPSGTITVPGNVAPGNYRMRVRNNWLDDPIPCGTDSYSETEDYTVTVVPCMGNQVVVSITTDSWPSETSWEIVDANNTVIASGAPSTANAVNNETVCLGNSAGAAWYGFKVEDSGNDGITGGGWELRTTDGKLILRDNFDMPFTSSPVVPGNSPTYGAYHSFALPLGAVNIQPDECGIMNNRADNKVYAVKQAGNNYLNSTLNYQFEFSNPDSGRFRRIAKPRNYVIFSEMASLKPLVAGVTYFARVRTDKEGVMTDARWGAGCEMALGSNVACTGLIDDPGHQYYSCNVTRRFRHSSFLVAKPVYGATQYEFRVYQPGEGYDHSFVRNTYTLELNWTAAEAPALEDLSSYMVQVRAKVNNVWGDFNCGGAGCSVYINNTPTIPQGSLVQVSGEATLWPNPSRDGQVSLNIDGIAGDVQHITVDVKDIYGQHVYGQEFANSGDRFNTVLDLPGDIATGVYMVNITVNGEVMTKRLSIVR